METTDAEHAWIPKVPRGLILEFVKRIKPVVRMCRDPLSGELKLTWGEAALYYIAPVDPFNRAYTWDPKPTSLADGLEPVCDIQTYHSYGYYGIFKPSVAEVLAQIPPELRNAVRAFEIISRPMTVGDLNRNQAALSAGYHVAVTRLYRR
ncbi:MAG: hypothetical protein M1153_01775 [Patescibacteria group bacterium]|nr:hypothetical protein [Patescibacteria group bacterium]